MLIIIIFILDWSSNLLIFKLFQEANVKRLMSVALALALVLVLAPWRAAIAGPVMGKGEDSEQTLKEKPDTKPIRCVGPVNMSNGVVLPPGKFATSLKYRYVHKNNLYDGSTRKTGNYNGKYDRVNQTMQLTVKAGIFRNFEMRVMAPFHIKQVKRKAGSPPSHKDTDYLSGFGDVVVMGRYALFSQRYGDWCHLAIGAGVKMPTGDADHENVAPFSNQHEYMGPGGQLGTGSWDPKFEIGATKFVGRSRFDAHLMYTVPGAGAHGSRKGNQFKYDIGYGYALSRDFDVELELNGVDQQPHIYDGSKTVNTGGHTIYITPGVHWKLGENYHLSLGVPIVVYRDLNGQSRTPDARSSYCLGEDFQVVARIGFTF